MLLGAHLQNPRTRRRHPGCEGHYLAAILNATSRGDEVYKTIAIEITCLDVKAHAITIRQTKQRLRWGILKSSSGHRAIDKDGARVGTTGIVSRRTNC